MFSWLKKLFKYNYFKIIKYEKINTNNELFITIYINGMIPIYFDKDIGCANAYVKWFVEEHKCYGVCLIEVVEQKDGNKTIRKKIID